MSRQIKFRIYNKKSHKWEEPAPLFALGLDGELIHIYNDDGEYVYKQFTGFLDKNGNEIFDGDIVSVEDLSEINSYWDGIPKKIAYSVDCGGDFPFAGYTVVNLKPADFETGFLLDCILAQHLKVIGNIFDDPELLKQ